MLDMIKSSPGASFKYAVRRGKCCNRIAHFDANSETFGRSCQWRRRTTFRRESILEQWHWGGNEPPQMTNHICSDLRKTETDMKQVTKHYTLVTYLRTRTVMDFKADSCTRL